MNHHLAHLEAQGRYVGERVQRLQLLLHCAAPVQLLQVQAGQ